MSHIFPTSPAKVNVKLLPTKAEFISYQAFSDRLDIHAWMPGGISSFSDPGAINREAERFYSNHCINCPKNTHSYFQKNYPQFFDSMGDFCRSRYNEHKNSAVDCFNYIEGYDFVEKLGDNDSYTCHAGHVLERPEIVENVVSNMVFRISHSLTDFGYLCDNAHLRAGRVTENGEIYATPMRGAANVYGANSDGGICWGTIYTRPKNLREIATNYFNSEFNSDLLSVRTFISNSERIEAFKASDSYSPVHNKKFLCSGYDSLLMLNADRDVQAFFTMLIAGFKPIPECGHIMLIPMKTSTIMRGEDQYLGYVTQEDAVGRKWYVSSEEYLIGQLDESFVCV